MVNSTEKQRFLRQFRTPDGEGSETTRKQLGKIQRAIDAPLKRRGLRHEFFGDARRSKKEKSDA
jgi:hypothetical protein